MGVPRSQSMAVGNGGAGPDRSIISFFVFSRTDQTKLHRIIICDVNKQKHSARSAQDESCTGRHKWRTDAAHAST